MAIYNGGLNIKSISIGTATVTNSGNAITSLSTNGNIITPIKDTYFWKSGDAVRGAIWNDLIDCVDVSEGDVLEPGYCYCMHEDGHYHKSEKYLDNRYIGIDSDTYSLAMGMETGKRKLNAAVSGFVLAYVDKEYPIGTPLTCTENGYLTELKKEDKCYNPEMIIAIYWTNEEKEEIVREDKTVKVNGRKWVKIK